MQRRRTMILRVLSALVLAAVVMGSPPPASALAASDSGHGGSSAHGGPSAVNPLNVEGANFKGDLALWTGVVFLVLLAILWRFAWRPLADGLAKRERRIHDEIASAQQSNAEARRLLEQYQQQLASAGEEVRRMLDAARREAEQSGAEIVQQARTAAQAERERAVFEIEAATAEALKELADRGATLAVELAGKIVGARLDRAAHARLIEQALERLSQASAGGGPRRAPS